MPTVAIPRKMLTKGRLPPVCVMTGERDAQLHRVLLTESLAWRVFLVWLFPPLLFFVDRLRVQLPMSRASRRRMRLAQWLTMPVLVVGHAVGLMTLFMLPLPLPQPLTVIVGYPLLVAALWLFYKYIHEPSVPTIDVAGDRVVLLGVPSERIADSIRGWLDTRSLPESVSDELDHIRSYEK